MLKKINVDLKIQPGFCWQSNCSKMDWRHLHPFNVHESWLRLKTSHKSKGNYSGAAIRTFGRPATSKKTTLGIQPTLPKVTPRIVDPSDAYRVCGPATLALPSANSAATRASDLCETGLGWPVTIDPWGKNTVQYSFSQSVRRSEPTSLWVMSFRDNLHIGWFAVPVSLFRIYTNIPVSLAGLSRSLPVQVVTLAAFPPLHPTVSFSLS